MLYGENLLFLVHEGNDFSTEDRAACSAGVADLTLLVLDIAGAGELEVLVGELGHCAGEEHTVVRGSHERVLDLCDTARTAVAGFVGLFGAVVNELEVVSHLLNVEVSVSVFSCHADMFLIVTLIYTILSDNLSQNSIEICVSFGFSGSTKSFIRSGAMYR